MSPLYHIPGLIPSPSYIIITSACLSETHSGAPMEPDGAVANIDALSALILAQFAATNARLDDTNARLEVIERTLARTAQAAPEHRRAPLPPLYEQLITEGHHCSPDDEQHQSPKDDHHQSPKGDEGAASFDGEAEPLGGSANAKPVMGLGFDDAQCRMTSSSSRNHSPGPDPPCDPPCCKSVKNPAPPKRKSLTWRMATPCKMVDADFSSPPDTGTESSTTDAKPLTLAGRGFDSLRRVSLSGRRCSAARVVPCSSGPVGGQSERERRFSLPSMLSRADSHSLFRGAGIGSLESHSSLNGDDVGGGGRLTMHEMEDDDELHRMLRDLKVAQRQSADELKADRRRRAADIDRHHGCVWPPDAPLMPYWNGLLAVLVCISGVAVPLQLAVRRPHAWRNFPPPASHILGVADYSASGLRTRIPFCPPNVACAAHPFSTAHVILVSSLKRCSAMLGWRGMYHRTLWTCASCLTSSCSSAPDS